MPYSLHHIHQRKRIHQKHEQFPHPNPGIRFLDRLLVVAAVAGPIVSIPQVVALYSAQTAEGFSLFTWVFFAILNIPWIVYGFVHHDKPIIIANILWLITNFLMIAGIIAYS